MTLPTPQGIMPGPHPMVAAGSQASGLSAPTLLDGAPPAFSSTAKASLLAIASRQAKKFCLKLDTVLKNPDIYIWLNLILQRRHDSLMVSSLASRLSSLGSSSCVGVVFSQCLSSPRCINEYQ